MFNFLAAAMAAFSLSSAAPAVAQEPMVIPATCSAQIASDTFGPEACHVVVQLEADGAMAVGFALAESGNVIFAGPSNGEGMNVVMLGFGEEPHEATGACQATDSVLICQATSEGVLVTVKATL